MSWINGPVTGASAASISVADPPDGIRVLRLEGGECASCEGDYDGIYVRSDLITVLVLIESWLHTASFAHFFSINIQSDTSHCSPGSVGNEIRVAF